MNREIPFLDMRRLPGDIINCWIVYLMPFDSDERSDYDKIHAFQKACIDNNIFGMGWDLTKEPLHFGTPIQEGADIYKERYGPNRSMEYALNQYKSIRKGDYVLMRLKTVIIMLAGRPDQPFTFSKIRSHLPISPGDVKWNDGKNIPQKRISHLNCGGGSPSGVTLRFSGWTNTGQGY